MSRARPGCGRTSPRPCGWRCRPTTRSFAGPSRPPAASCSAPPAMRSPRRSSRPSGPCDAATEAQRALDGHAWPDGAPIRVRMGVHTGSAHQRDDNFYGPTLNRAARLMSAAHGGQTVLSSATLPLVDDVPVRDLGEHRLKDLSEPERVWQLIVDGLSTDFPPLRTLDAAPTNLPMAASSFIGRAGRHRRGHGRPGGQSPRHHDRRGRGRQDPAGPPGGGRRLPPLPRRPLVRRTGPRAGR